MDKKQKNRIFGLTERELLIFAIMGGSLLCVIIVFGGYIIYDLNRANPDTASPRTSIQQQV